MTRSPTLAIIIGVSLTFSSLGLTTTAQAAGLNLKDSGQAQPPRPARPNRDNTGLSAEPRHARGEVAASQDFAAECILHGGGASTDPDGLDTCTSPDGENIIVPFP